MITITKSFIGYNFLSYMHMPVFFEDFEFNTIFFSNELKESDSKSHSKVIV